jgi:hypothetical protein
MVDNYPHVASDPDTNGIPDYADDESTAYDDVDSSRLADGPDPAALPPDRDAGPLALDEFGTTAEEQRRGESLDARLARELPDVSSEVAGDDPHVAAPFEGVPFDSGYPGGAAGPDDPGDELILADVPVEPQLNSAVSMYDRIEPGLPPTDRVGRLVAPDEGAHEDAEPDEVALDLGAAGGGASAEELAMNAIPDDDAGLAGEALPAEVLPVGEAEPNGEVLPGEALLDPNDPEEPDGDEPGDSDDGLRR